MKIRNYCITFVIFVLLIRYVSRILCWRIRNCLYLLGDQNKHQICWKKSGFMKIRSMKPSDEQITRQRKYFGAKIKKLLQ